MSDQPDEIQPDTRDWSLVVAAGCDQCGFRSQPTEVIAGWTLAMIPLWRERLQQPDARTRPGAGVWSPTEYAAHVRDLSLLFVSRLDSVLSLDEPELASWDQNEAAVSGEYQRLDPQEVSTESVRALESIASAFAGVCGSQWERRARRSDGWGLTVGDLANYFLHDVIHHLGDVGVIFALPGDDGGVPPALSR